MRRRRSELLSVIVFSTWACAARAAPSVPQESSPSPSSERLRRWLPDFFKLQSGGFSGSFTVGAGYAPFGDLFNVALLYGYVPPAAGGSVQSLHMTLTARPLSVSSRDVRWLPAYLGGGALCTWGDGYFLMLPKRYPGHYYAQNACHFTAHVGVEVQWLPRQGWAKAYGIYGELTTVDTLLFDYFQNPRVTAPIDVVSSSLGFRLAI